MFTYMELQNFMSFGHIMFDFRKTKKEAKKFIAVYGENGSGKSNFVSAFELLLIMVNSLARDEGMKALREMLTDPDLPDDISLDSTLRAILIQNDLMEYMKNCRMINCEEATKIEYGFILDGKEGYYRISFTDRIEQEELYYTAKKQRGILFSISNENGRIKKSLSNTAFIHQEYKKDLGEQIEKFWGRHTFLGILLQEKLKKNETYMKQNISSHLNAVMEMLTEMFVSCKSYKSMRTGVIADINLNRFDFAEGTIDIDEEEELDRVESIIKDFFTQTYSDINDIYYKKKTNRSHTKIRYQLYVNKMIFGEMREVQFNAESTGTQNVLEILSAIIAAVSGSTVIYDEIDGGIHDLLMKNILLSVSDSITGQFIITTHNTGLLETLDPKSVYVICVDSEGNKEARCVDDYDIRIQESNNLRNLYLKGIFGGVPYSSDIDYSYISEQIQAERGGKEKGDM